MKVASLLLARAEVGDLDEFRQVRRLDALDATILACQIKEAK